MAALAAEDIVIDDRRRIINAGVLRGRDANIAQFRAAVDFGMKNVTSTVIAIRGERLFLDRLRFSGPNEAPEPFYSEILRVLEIDAHDRITAAVYLDPEDTAGAFAERK